MIKKHQKTHDDSLDAPESEQSHAPVVASNSARARVAVQRRAERAAATGAARVHQAAEAGVAGASATLPHHDAIQASFGRHDVGQISAQVGGAGADACDAMGARAYATDNRVAFASTPDLHTAAHEAAHVVQQRAGVQLKSGVGRVGDTYEQHADQVADAVVRGESAEALLDRHAGSGQASGGVQRAVQMDSKQDALDLEARDGGHSIDRHGPEVSDQALKDRLTTGVAPDNAVAPAPGLSTKFGSYELYLETRQAAVNKCKSGLQATFLKFKPLLKAVKDAQAAFDTAPSGPEKAPTGSVGKPLKDAKDALQAAGDGMSKSNANMFQVKVAANAKNLQNKVLLYQSYEVVMDHGKKVGGGFEGLNPQQTQHPRDSTKDDITVYQNTQDAGDITQTRTTFDLGAKLPLLQQHNPATWQVAQHFPCQEVEGIHGPS